MGKERTELNHAERVERDLAEWKKIFSLSERAYGWRIDGYKGKQELVYIPDSINGELVSFIGESFKGTCAIICNKRLWSKFDKSKLRIFRVRSAVAYLKHPEAFPDDCIEHVQSFIRYKANEKEIITLMIREDDADAFAAFLDFTGRIFSLKEIDTLLETSSDTMNIRPLLIDWKQKHYSVEEQDKHQNQEEEKELGIRTRTVADWKILWTWFKKPEGTIALSRYLGNEKTPSIPTRIGRTNVTEIDGLKNKKSLQSVIIPEGIKSIGFSAFENCSNLSSVLIPESVIYIGNKAFKGCPDLTIHAPAGSYAAQYAREKNIPFVAI